MSLEEICFTETSFNSTKKSEKFSKVAEEKFKFAKITPQTAKRHIEHEHVVDVATSQLLHARPKKLMKISVQFSRFGWCRVSVCLRHANAVWCHRRCVAILRLCMYVSSVVCVVRCAFFNPSIFIGTTFIFRESELKSKRSEREKKTINCKWHRNERKTWLSVAASEKNGLK